MNRLLLLCALLFSLPVPACTLWGAAGADAGGGTLMAKNRDWKPDHRQLLKRVRPSKGFAYFGLYVEGNDDPGLKAGVNEAGLSIVSASSNIAKKLRDAQRDKHGVMARVLSDYASIDALLTDADAIFSRAKANFYLISDRSKLMLVEVGLEGKFATRVVAQGVAAHTNHYLDPALAGHFDDAPGISSATRLARIDRLLDQAPRPLSSDAFVTMSGDRNDGPNNSLWRNARSPTLASWIVSTPADGAARLRVLIANPDEAQRTEQIVLDEAFWRGESTAY